MATHLHIEGTHCQSCKMLIEEIGLEQPGVSKIEVHYETGDTLVEHDATFNLEDFKKEVESLGDYAVHLIETE